MVKLTMIQCVTDWLPTGGRSGDLDQQSAHTFIWEGDLRKLRAYNFISKRPVLKSSSTNLHRRPHSTALIRRPTTELSSSTSASFDSGAMVHKKDTRKKHKLLICYEKGPPPYDISANSLKFKDWYDEGFIVSPVRDQLDSTYCWAIAIATVVKAMINIANPLDKKQVSHQYLINNVEQRKDTGPSGLYKAWHHVKTYGICEEKDCETNPEYKPTKSKEVEADKKLKILTFDEPTTVREMQLIDQLNKGPVVATIKVIPPSVLGRTKVKTTYTMDLHLKIGPNMVYSLSMHL